MHYKNGREARNGDPIVGESFKGSGTIVAGVLHSTMPGSTSCNGQIAIPIPGGCANWSVTVGDFYHAQDAFVVIDQAQKVPTASSSPAEKSA